MNAISTGESIIAAIGVLTLLIVWRFNTRLREAEFANEQMAIALIAHQARMGQISTDHSIFIGEIREAVRLSFVPLGKRLIALETAQNTMHELLLEIRGKGERTGPITGEHSQADR